MNLRLLGESLLSITSVTLFSLSSLPAWGWGERGHHVVGRSAAQLINAVAEENAAAAELSEFMKERALQMGHLANVPDFSWKESTRHDSKLIGINSPTHYIDVEILLGAPTKDLKEYASQLRKLSPDFAQILKTYQGKPNPLPGTPAKYKNIDLYNDVGTNPWRVQDLYAALVSAWACAKSKEGGSDLKAERKNFKSPLVARAARSPQGYYQCTKKQTRLEALSAAVAIAGVLGHFVGDLAQPFHLTVNFDGWESGNGGVHHYLEEAVVEALPPSLEDEVFRRAQESGFRKEQSRALAINWGEPLPGSRFALALAEQSYLQMNEALRLDNQFAIIKKGTIVPSGDKSFLFDREKYQPAERKPAATPEVLRGHRSFVTDRLASGSLALAAIWYQAWLAGGSPKVADANGIAIPYILDVPFLWPNY